MGICRAPKIAEAMAVASYSKDDNRILLLMEDYGQPCQHLYDGVSGKLFIPFFHSFILSMLTLLFCKLYPNFL